MVVQDYGKEFRCGTAESHGSLNAVKQEGQITFAADVLFIMEADFIIQHPSPEKKEVILINLDDAFQLIDKIEIGMFGIYCEIKTACFIDF